MLIYASKKASAINQSPFQAVQGYFFADFCHIFLTQILA